MENWGLITFRETSLLVGKNSSLLEKQVVASVVAHELAHQVRSGFFSTERGFFLLLKHTVLMVECSLNILLPANMVFMIVFCSQSLITDDRF